MARLTRCNSAVLFRMSSDYPRSRVQCKRKTRVAQTSAMMSGFCKNKRGDPLRDLLCVRTQTLYRRLGHPLHGIVSRLVPLLSATQQCYSA